VLRGSPVTRGEPHLLFALYRTGLACFYTGQATAHDDPTILACNIERAFDQLQG
jgi:hypothetical protein